MTRYSGGEPVDQHPEFPQDADRFALRLEDDRKLHKPWLIAGVLSEAALIGMLITSLQEPGPGARVVLTVLVVGLGWAMGLHVARFRIDGQPRRGPEIRALVAAAPDDGPTARDGDTPPAKAAAR